MPPPAIREVTLGCDHDPWCFETRGMSKFTGPNHQCFIQHATLLQIGDQPVIGLSVARQWGSCCFMSPYIPASVAFSCMADLVKRTPRSASRR